MNMAVLTKDLEIPLSAILNRYAHADALMLPLHVRIDNAEQQCHSTQRNLEIVDTTGNHHDRQRAEILDAEYGRTEVVRCVLPSRCHVNVIQCLQKKMLRYRQVVLGGYSPKDLWL